MPRATGIAIHAVHASDAVTLTHESRHHRARTQLHPLTHQRGDDGRRDIVLGFDRAGKGVTGRACLTRVSCRPGLIVDRQGKPKWVEPEIARCAVDDGGGSREAGCLVRIWHRARWLRGIDTAFTGDVEQPLRPRVKGLELIVPEGPTGA